MKKLQGSAIAKACAWILLLAAAFGAGTCGVRTVLCLQAVTSDSWQGSYRFSNALEDRRRELMEGIDLALQIRELEERIAGGETSPMVHADLEALQEQWEALEKRSSRTETWFRFRVMRADDRTVMGTNLLDSEAMTKAVRRVYHHTFQIQGNDLLHGESYYEYDEGAERSPEPDDINTEMEPVELVLECGVPEELGGNIRDEFSRIRDAWNDDRASFDGYLTGALDLSALTLIALIWVLWTAGHKNGVEGTAATWQERIFFDLYAAAMIGIGTICLFGAVWAAQETYLHSTQQFYWSAMEPYEPMGIMVAAALCACVVVAAALLLRTFAVRMKARCLVQTTLLCRVCTWTVRTVHEFVRFLPITWKAVLGFGAYVLFSFWLIVVGRYEDIFMLMYFFLQLALLLFLGWWSYSYYRLRKGTKTIAKGDLEYQIDARRMPYDLRVQAEDLNNISAGLSTAVDERLKSERFKAELITNVSHDLKTPLTSIINYVDLLKSTDQADPKAVEYIEVLDRKSQRLKKLTEDLVEASKASTGVLSVSREKIGMSQLIDQALGEWEEKLDARKLTLVTTLPEGETWVYADGRHLWRVIDNLLSNCAKYAMEGTRIYLDLERGKGQVALSVKNISREQLNVPAEQLMERFVRGEESRSTEGSGLGLSIARSLTELQGGTFELAVDGDLFKAIVTLPQAS